MQDLTVLIPAHNEEATIAAVIDELLNLVNSPNIIVIDNASNDMTASVLHNGYRYHEKVKILYEGKKGKGNAINTGIRHVETPYVAMMNADMTYPALDIVYLYYLLQRQNADVAIGYRNIKDKGAMSFTSSIGNWLLSLFSSLLYQKRVYDVCTGMWVFKTDVLKSFNLESKGFTLEVDLWTHAVKAKTKIIQIPIGYRARPENSHSKLAPFKHGWEVLMFLLKRRFQ